MLQTLFPLLVLPLTFSAPEGTSDTVAERFAEGTISCGSEFAAAFSPDGDTLYLTRRTPTDGTQRVDILVSLRHEGGWSEPELAPFSSAYRDADAFVSPDGTRVYFMSTRPLPGAEADDRDYDLWSAAVLEDGGWGEPEHLGFPVNSVGTWEGFPTVTDAGTLFFFSEREGGQGKGDIYRAEVQGNGYGAPANLGAPINSEHWDGLPYISPGEWILVFASDRPGGAGGLDLYVSYRTGSSWSKPENLGPRVNTAEDELFPHIAPDGESFFFSRFHAQGERHVYSVPTEASGIDLQQAGHWDLKHSNPSWAPDGDRIAFDSNRTGNFDVFVTDRTGDSLLNLTAHPAKERHPDFSADGKWILFDSDRAGSADIWRIRSDGSDLQRLTVDEADEERPFWSPDGRRILFTSNRDGNREVYVMNADGSDLANLSRHPGTDFGCSWSPDGERVAFESDRHGNRDVFTMRTDGSSVVRLTNDPATDRRPHWSPDGERILFSSERGESGTEDLYTMRPDGSDVVQVFASAGHDWAPRWSRDGRTIAFASRHGRERHVHALALESLEVDRLTSATRDDYSAVYEQLAKLVGTWQEYGQENEANSTVVYSLTGAGAVLVEDFMSADGSTSVMSTLYHLDGPELRATHYCGATNQPRFRAVSYDDEIGVVRFESFDVTNLSDPQAYYTRVIELTLAGPDDLQIHFNGLYAGVESPGTHTLRRVR